MIPDPRSLVVHSGERLLPTKEEMEVVDSWFREQYDSIRVDPSFFIDHEFNEGPVYPWEGLEINETGDTAVIQIPTGPGGPTRPTVGAYHVYAHLYLMEAQGRLDRWLPEAVDADPFELERAVLGRVADVWLHQRTLYDAAPYGLLDELIYAKENDFLDEFILTARPDAFVEARRQWLADDPGGADAYREWFVKTFEREPPGMRGGSGG